MFVDGKTAIVASKIGRQSRKSDGRCARENCAGIFVKEQEIAKRRL